MLKKLTLLFLILFLGFFSLRTAYSYNNDLNIVHISDIHLDTKTKSGGKRMLGQSVELFQNAILQINKLQNVDLVVFSGDVVNKPDKNDFLKFISIANNLKVAWLYAPGNHDVGIFGGLSKQEIIKFLCENSPYFNEKSLYYSYSPNKKFLILFMDGVIDNKITANGFFPKEQLNWLNNQLRCNPDKKIIIVQHFPVVEPFESSTHYTLNAQEYLNIIDKYNNVIAVLSGHYHAAKTTQRNGVLHISAASLVEHSNAFNQIKITLCGDKARVDIK